MKTLNQLDKEIEKLKKANSSKQYINRLNELINLKAKAETQLADLVMDLTNLKFKFENQKSELLLTTDWSEVIDGRVTNDLKEAYITIELSDLLKDISRVEANSSILKREINLLDDCISSVKYSMRLILNEL